MQSYALNLPRNASAWRERKETESVLWPSSTYIYTTQVLAKCDSVGFEMGKREN